MGNFSKDGMPHWQKFIHDPDPEIFKRKFHHHVYRVNDKFFAGSGAMAEVCGL